MVTDEDIDIIVATLVGDDELVSAMLDDPETWESDYREIIAAAVGDESVQLDEEDLLEIKESVEDVVAADTMADTDAMDVDEDVLDQVDALADQHATGFDQHTKNVMHAAQEVAKALASGDEGTASVKVQENDEDGAPDRVVVEDVPAETEAEDEDDLLEENDEAGDISNDAKNSTNSIAKYLSDYRW